MNGEFEISYKDDIFETFKNEYMDTISILICLSRLPAISTVSIIKKSELFCELKIIIDDISKTYTISTNCKGDMELLYQLFTIPRIDFNVVD